MIRAICIGGSKDRQELTGLHGRELRVYSPPREIALMDSRGGVPRVAEIFTLNALESRFETYRYEVLAQGDRRWTFWVHESLSNDQAFAKVIDGYGVKQE